MRFSISYKALIISILCILTAPPLGGAELRALPGDTLAVDLVGLNKARYLIMASDTLTPLAPGPAQVRVVVPPREPGLDTLRILNADGDTLELRPVTIPNRAPYFTADTFLLSFPEDSTVSVAKALLQSGAADDDLNSDLSFRLIPGQHIRFSQDSLAYTFIPEPDWFGEETLLYIVNDGSLSDTLKLPVTVIPVNDAPVLTQPEADFAMEDELVRRPFSLLHDLVTDVDTPADSLTWRYLHGSHIKISPEGSQLTLLGDENWYGLDTLRAVVSDGEFSDTLYWEFTLIAVNDPPVLAPMDPIEFLEDDTLTLSRDFLQGFASDVETDAADLKWQMKRLGRIRAFYNGARLLCSASENWYGTDSIRVTLSDGELSVSRTLILHILPVNDAPVIQTIPDQVFREDDTLFISHRYLSRYVSDVETRDKDLSWIYEIGKPLQVEDQPSRVKFFAERNWFGRGRARLIVSDGELADTAWFRVTVKSVNDKPVVISPPAGVFKEDDTLRVALKNIYSYAHDVEIRNSDLLWRIENGRHVKALKKNGTFRIYADRDWFGNDTLSLIVSDGGLKDTARWAMSVTPVNDAPRWQALPDTCVDEDNMLILPRKWFMSHIIDPDPGDTVSIWLTGSKNIDVETRGDTFVVWPYTDWFGKEALTLGATDGHVKDSVKWMFTVNAVDDPPYFTIYMPDSISFSADRADTLFMNDIVYDIDNRNDDLTWEIRDGRFVKCFIDDKQKALIFHTENFAAGEDAVTLHVTDGENTIIQYLPVYVKEVDRFLMAIPERLELFPNSPNPFKAYTHITYSLPVAGHVTLKIYNILGEEVKSLISEFQDPQNYRFVWYGEDESGGSVPSGVYLCRLVAQLEGETVVKMQKMMLVR